MVNEVIVHATVLGRRMVKLLVSATDSLRERLIFVRWLVGAALRNERDFHSRGNFLHVVGVLLQ